MASLEPAGCEDAVLQFGRLWCHGVARGGETALPERGLPAAGRGGGCGADVNCAHTSPSSCLSLPVPGAADGRKSFHVSASPVPGSAEADGRRVAASTYDQLVAWGPLDRLVNR